MKAVVAAFNQEKALVGAFSVITNLRMEIFEALIRSLCTQPPLPSTIYSRSKEQNDKSIIYLFKDKNSSNLKQRIVWLDTK